MWQREYGTCVVHAFGLVRQNLQPSKCFFLFLVFEVSAFLISYEMYFFDIFNYFVIFNHGMCKFLDRVMVWKPVSVIRSRLLGIVLLIRTFNL